MSLVERGIVEHKHQERSSCMFVITLAADRVRQFCRALNCIRMLVFPRIRYAINVSVVAQDNSGYE